jgi:hypothetical protein
VSQSKSKSSGGERILGAKVDRTIPAATSAPQPHSKEALTGPMVPPGTTTPSRPVSWRGDWRLLDLVPLLALIGCIGCLVVIDVWMASTPSARPKALDAGKPATLPVVLDWSTLPVATEVSAVLSARKGGSLAFADGVGVQIPAGALPADTRVTLRRRAVPDAQDRLVTVTEVDAGDMTLAADATLTLPLPPSDPFDAGDYRVYRIHRGRKVEVPRNYHRYRRLVEVRTRSFSGWEVLWDSTIGKAAPEIPLLWVETAGPNAHQKYYATFVFHSEGTPDRAVCFNNQPTWDFDHQPVSQRILANITSGKDGRYYDIGFHDLKVTEDVKGYRILENEPNNRQLCGGLAIAPLAGGPYLFPTGALWSAIKDRGKFITDLEKLAEWDMVLFSDGQLLPGGGNLQHYALIAKVGPGFHMLSKRADFGIKREIVPEIEIVTKNREEKIYRGSLWEYTKPGSRGEKSLAEALLGTDDLKLSYFRLPWAAIKVRRGPTLELKFTPESPVKAGRKVRGELKVKVRDLPAQCTPGNFLTVHLALDGGGLQTEADKDLEIGKIEPDPALPELGSQEYTFQLDDDLPLEIATNWLDTHEAALPLTVSAFFARERVEPIRPGPTGTPVEDSPTPRILREFPPAKAEITVVSPDTAKQTVWVLKGAGEFIANGNVDVGIDQNYFEYPAADSPIPAAARPNPSRLRLGTLNFVRRRLENFSDRPRIDLRWTFRFSEEIPRVIRADGDPIPVTIEGRLELLTTAPNMVGKWGKSMKLTASGFSVTGPRELFLYFDGERQQHVLTGQATWHLRLSDPTADRIQFAIAHGEDYTDPVLRFEYEKKDYTQDQLDSILGR